jgi:rubrerythrin
MAFQNPFVGNIPNRKEGSQLNEGELVRALRLDLASEEEATSTYMAHADATDNSVVKEVLTSIANEERVHAGELQQLLDIVTSDEFKFLFDGFKEVSEKTGLGNTPKY